MKILSISSIPLLPHLGSGRTRLHWTKGLKELGHEVDVLEPKNFELFPSIHKAKKYKLAIGILFKVKKLLKNKTYDVIEFYGDEYWLMLKWVKKSKYKLPLLVAHADGVELHDMDKAQIFWDKKKGIKKWLFDNTHYHFARRTFSLADYLVCGCNDDLQYMISRKYFSIQNAACIAPGIEDSFHAISFQTEKKNIISFVGSWIGRKGISIIPLVINEVLKKNKKFFFHIFGTRTSGESIIQNFDASIRERVIVFDKMSLEELQKNILNSSIFFMPTYSEGFGLSVAEAMSCGCAVVTTPTGIGKELINTKEAFICDFDDVQHMVSSINFLIDNSNKREQLAYNGWSRAKEYVWQTEVKKLETTYLNWHSNRVL